MSKSFQTGAGNKVKIHVALLPLGVRTEPVNVTVTTSSGGITNSSTSITVNALSGAIAAGTPLLFSNGSATPLKVYLALDAKAGDTTLTVDTTTAALTGTCTATYTAKLRLLGGTQSGANIGADVTESLVFEDPLGYADGVITKQNWELPWTANLLSSDDAFRRVFYAATNAISGREVYVWQEDPPPSGYTTGDGMKGSCVVTSFQRSFPSEGIVTWQATFKGQGSPTITRYS
jgi:hypothetical protein